MKQVQSCFFNSIDPLGIYELYNFYPILSAYNSDLLCKRARLLCSDEALPNMVAGDPLQLDLIVIEPVGNFNPSDSTPIVNLVSITHKGWFLQVAHLMLPSLTAFQVSPRTERGSNIRATLIAAINKAAAYRRV
jgi:hypothetical protein